MIKRSLRQHRRLRRLSQRGVLTKAEKPEFSFKFEKGALVKACISMPERMDVSCIFSLILLLPHGGGVRCLFRRLRTPTYNRG